MQQRLRILHFFFFFPSRISSRETRRESVRGCFVQQLSGRSSSLAATVYRGSLVCYTRRFFWLAPESEWERTQRPITLLRFSLRDSRMEVRYVLRLQHTIRAVYLDVHTYLFAGPKNILSVQHREKQRQHQKQVHTCNVYASLSPKNGKNNNNKKKRWREREREHKCKKRGKKIKVVATVPSSTPFGSISFAAGIFLGF